MKLLPANGASVFLLPLVIKKNWTASGLTDLSSKWCQLESNQRHKDFQSFALPTELWHHHVGAANVLRFFVSENFF